MVETLLLYSSKFTIMKSRTKAPFGFKRYLGRDVAGKLDTQDIRQDAMDSGPEVIIERSDMEV